MAPDGPQKDSGQTGVSRMPAQRTGAALGDMWGWDPFRNFFPQGGMTHGMDVQRTENGYTVEVPVAGFKPNEIDVSFQEGVVTVSGKSDRRSFTRSLMLPEDIDPEKIAARVEHGMLTLSLERLPETKPRKINVEFNK